MLRLPFAFLLTGLIAAPLTADIVVTVEDVDIPIGEIAFIDVTIASDGTDLLQNFGIEFNIATTSGSSSLRFLQPPTPDPTLTIPDYVFFGNSFKFIGDPPMDPGPFEFGQVVGDDVYTASDETFDFANVTFTEQLLVRLQVTIDDDPPPEDGDMYLVSVNEANTFFNDTDFNPLDFSTFGGTTTAVPEPGSLILVALFVVGVPAIFRRRTAKGLQRC